MKLRTMINTRTKGLLAAVLMLGLTQACSDSTDPKTTTKVDSISAHVIEVSDASIAGSKEFAGVIKSTKRSELGTKVMGTIRTMPVSIGEKVNKGDLLLHIADSDLIAQKRQIESGLNSAKANFQLADKNYKRFETLFEQKSATQKEWDEIQLNHSMAKNKVTEVENQLKGIEDLLTYTQIKAPFTGIVAAKNAEVGDLVSPGRPLIVIENTEDFEIEFSVPESDINKLQLGDKLQVFIASVSNKPQNATITDISTAGQQFSNQYKVKVKPELPSEHKNTLRSGMHATVHLPSSTSGSIGIPASALVTRGQLEGIYVLNTQDKAILRWIRTGSKNSEYVEVLSGLKAGERIIAESALILRDAQKISPIN